jgi:hypothetical protein
MPVSLRSPVEMLDNDLGAVRFDDLLSGRIMSFSGQAGTDGRSSLHFPPAS